MKKYLIQHVADLPGADYVFAEQVIRIINSGMLDHDTEYHICINGNSQQFQEVIDHITEIANPKIKNLTDDCRLIEYPTLAYVKDLADSLDQTAYIGYIHLKGVSRNLPGVTDWRHLLEYFSIDQYSQCLHYLDQGYDIVGCNWVPVSWIKPHFSGNFWWANSDYIKKLQPLLHPDLCQPGTRSEFSGLVYGVYWSDVWQQPEDRSRFDHECWIASQQPKAKSLFNSGVDHYRQPFPEEKYRNYTVS